MTQDELRDLTQRVQRLEDVLAATLSAVAQQAVQPTCSDEYLPHHHEIGFGPHERTHLLDLARELLAEKVGS